MKISAATLLLIVAVNTAANAATVISPVELSAFNHQITFGEFVLPMGTVVTDQFISFGVSLFTVTIPRYSTSDMRYDVQGSVGGCASIPGGGDSCFNGLNGHTIGSTGANPVLINFTSTQNYAVFGLASNPREFTFTALLAGQPVESFSIYSTGGSTPTVNGSLAGYYGFTGINFDAIAIQSVLNNQYDNRILLDNIQFENLASPVPLPATWQLFVSGLLLLFGRSRFRPNQWLHADAL